MLHPPQRAARSFGVTAHHAPLTSIISLGEMDAAQAHAADARLVTGGADGWCVSGPRRWPRAAAGG